MANAAPSVIVTPHNATKHNTMSMMVNANRTTTQTVDLTTPHASRPICVHLTANVKASATTTKRYAKLRENVDV